jgi:hypothetical protein
MIVMLRAFAAVFILFTPYAAFAQTTAAAPPADQSQQQLLSAGQLDALVAPIALYPDALLSEILMASTYPLEVVEADRWAGSNKNLKGDALKAAVDKQSWDDSVKSLTATPDVLDMMSSKLDWTQQIGDAVLAQQPDVMDAIQRLRSKAQANNKLTSNKQQTVTTQQQNGQPVIMIAPTDPNYVYVPYYDPGVVYGSWPYPAYPPYYWPTPGYIAGGVIATGLAFGAGYAIGRWASNGCCWGGGFNWGGNNITVNRNVNINNISGNNWNHNPAHRGGVRYNNTNVAAKFGGNRTNIANGAGNRMDFRGRSGNQVLNPGAGNRPNVGGGGANRPNVGAGGNRPNTGGGGNARPAGGGNRSAAGGGNRPVAGGGGRPAGNGLGNISAGRTAAAEGARGRASLGGSGGGGPARGGGGGGVARGGGGGGGGGVARGGGGGGGGRGGGGGGGRRSDMRLKHDIVPLGRLDDGLGFYRFAYNGSDRTYVGVMAQEVQAVMPGAVTQGRDGYLRVYYDKLGVKFQTYKAWLAAGAKIPNAAVVAH